MSTELFNRTATVVVGKNKLTGKKYAGFRVQFEIDKTSESSPNPAQIRIFNLSKSTRSAFEEKGLVVLLNAGYATLGSSPIERQIYAGDVRRTYTRRQGPDLVTTLEAGDAEIALRGTHVEQSYGEFTSPSQVIQGLASKLGVSIGTIVPSLANLFQNGLSLSGLVSDHLDTLTSQAGLEWHVTDGELNVLDPKLPTPEPAVLVSKDTGLIGFPSKTLQGIIEFNSLLNPELKPGRAVSLVSEAITGVFRVRRVKYRGDTFGGDWVAAVEAI